MKEKIRVAAYCRVSTDKDDQANSLESQEKYFAEYIKSHENWKFVKIYSDEGRTGTSTSKRGEFLRMIDDARNGKLDYIITKEVSRFARNTVDSLYYTRELKAIGVGVIFTLDRLDSLNDESEFTLTLMSSIAQEESRKTSERVKWGQIRQMERGVVFGRDLLGYTVKNGQLYVNDEEAKVVKLIFHKFLNEDKGTHVIARELYEEHIRPKRAKQWSNTIILKILRNEKYVGDLLQRKTITPNFLDHKKKYNKDKDSMVYIKDHHEAIIDRDIWDRTQEELERRSPSDEQKTKHSNRYWCSGKLECGECGAKVVSRTKKVQNGMYKAWRCYASANHGMRKEDRNGNVVGCNNKPVNEKVLLECVRKSIEYIQINTDDLVGQLIDEIKSLKTSAAKIGTEKLYGKLDIIDRKKIDVINLHLEGTISKDEMVLMKDNLEEERQRVLSSIEEAENSNAIMEAQVNDLDKYIIEIKNMLDFKSDNTLMYKEILNKIVLFDNRELVVFLKYVPLGIRMRYSTSGKLEKYKVVIDLIGIE